MGLNIWYLFSCLFVLLVLLNSASNSFTCNFIDSSSSLVCSGKGQCISNENCSCLSGYSGSYCDISVDPLAGYRLITNADVKIQNVPADKLVMKSSIVVHSMSIQKYVANGSAVITLASDVWGQSLISHAQNILNQVDTGPCQYDISPFETNLTVVHGGIYCFAYGWTPTPSQTTVTVVGPEPAVFRIKSNFQFNKFNFVFLDGATYRNVYYIVTLASSIIGDFEGVLVPNGDSLSYSTGVLKGAIWYFGGSSKSLNFDNVQLTAPLTWDPYQPLTQFNNVTKCYQISSTDPSVCSGKGSCISYNTCACNDGQGDATCSTHYCGGIIHSNSSVCLGRGVCVSGNQCTCNSGFYGSNCEVVACFGELGNSTNVCSSHGTCIETDKCSCQEHYFGNLCENTYCYNVSSNSSQACSAAGSCIDFNRCQCNEDYQGVDCSITRCFSELSNSSFVCSGNGYCISANNCTCNEHYSGLVCDTTFCNSILSNSSNVCSGKGRCDSFNNCTCQQGYYGNNCELFSCNGTMKNDSLVCNGYGNCTDYNKCACVDGVFGDWCEVFTCGNVLSNHSDTCNSHGQCVGLNSCQCQKEYKGSDCEITTCYNVDSNNETVCNSHGTCIDFNTCNCSTGYFGSNCSLTSCNQVHSNSSNVCSGKGFCYEFDKCVCYEKTNDLWCLPTCFGIFANSSLVCNGRGICESQDYCLCNNSFGPNCDIFSCANVLSNSSFVCSGSGNCTDNNKCVCKQGYFGDNCQYFNCFQIEHNNQSVCANGRGQCIDVDTCACNSSYHGAMCQETFCFGMKSDNNSVCSGNGKCVDFNMCECQDIFYGKECEILFTNVTNTTVNSSSPIISNWTGDSNITNQLPSNSSTFNNATSVESNSTNISTNISKIDESKGYSNGTNSSYPSGNSSFANSSFANSSVTNSSFTNSSVTNLSDTNSTFANSTFANSSFANSSFANSSFANSSFTNSSFTNSTNFHNTSVLETLNSTTNSTSPTIAVNSTSNTGDYCSSFIEGPLIFTKDFKGVSFHIRVCSQNSSSIKTCSNLIHPTDLPKFGLSSGMKCDYIDETNNLFMISFGNQYNIKSGDIIRLKQQNESVSVEYISLEVVSPLNGIIPTSEIETSNFEVIGGNSDIYFDGSASKSEDGKPLVYIWELVNALNKSQVIAQFPDQPFVKFGSQQLPDGQYAISLTVKSETSSWKSNTTFKYFSKVSHPLPSIYIPENNVEVYTHQFPVTIRKIVSDANNGKYVVEWEQLGGPPIEYNMDSFDNICINSLKTFGNHIYTFRVIAYNVSTPEWKVFSNNITLITKTQAMTLEIVQTEVNENFTKFAVVLNDPERSVNTQLEDTWMWASDYSNPALKDFLDKISKEKTKSLTIHSSLFGTNIPQSISLTLFVSNSDGRNVSTTMLVYFGNIPPLAWSNLDLKTEKPMVKGEIISIQAFPISNIDTTKTKVLLNNELISESTFSSIDTSNLPEGSNNTITIVAFDEETGASTETTYTFTIAIAPKPCFCKVSPYEGIALQSTFEFYCSNCKDSANSIDYKYGFIDDRSGTKIYLKNLGDIYASKLPSPFQGSILTCFFDIIDTSTGASITVLSNVTIINPYVNKVEDVQGLVQAWSFEASQYLLVGDFSKSIYQSATTSRTDSVLLREAFNTEKRTIRTNIVCVNGVDIGGKCRCVDGFLGEHCDKSVKDFSSIQSTKLQLLSDMFFVANNTGISNLKQEYISLVAFAIDSLLFNYPYLNSLTISESLSTLNMFLYLTLSDSSLRLANGAESLLHQTLESAFRYIEDKSLMSDQTRNSLSLLRSLKMTIFLQAKGLLVSEKKNMKGSFFSLVMGRSLVFDYARVIEETNTLTRIEMESDVFYSQISKMENNRPYVYVLFVVQDIFGLHKQLQIPKAIEDNQYQVSHLISQIVSIEIVHNIVEVNEGSVIYMLPINRTSTEISKNGPLDITTYQKTYHCKNFHDGQISIRSECVLQSIGRDYAKCKCSRFTNVFVVETITYRNASLFFVVIIAAILLLACACSFIFVVGFVCYVRKCVRKKKELQDWDFRVQRIIMKSPREDLVAPENSIKKQPTKKIQPVNSHNHKGYDFNQVVPVSDHFVELNESSENNSSSYENSSEHENPWNLKEHELVTQPIDIYEKT